MAFQLHNKVQFTW